MKKTVKIYNLWGKEKVTEKEIQHIPLRFLFAMLLILLETAAVIVIVILCALYIPYFYLAMWATEIFCVLKIINSEENPDYKIPWLLFVLVVPVAGFMIYFMFYDRKLSKKQIKRIATIGNQQVHTPDGSTLEKLKQEDKLAYSQANHLCKIANTHVYQNTQMKYYPMGEELYAAMLEDLKTAEKFIFMEYFIVEEGKFWDSILEILKEKAALCTCRLFLY